MTIDRTQLKRLREFAGFSIRQLARQAGISHSHLAYIERGQKGASEGVTKKLADALNVHMEELMMRNG